MSHSPDLNNLSPHSASPSHAVSSAPPSPRVSALNASSPELERSLNKTDADMISVKRNMRNASVGGTFQAVREGSLFEYFLVVGVTSNTIRQNPGATTYAPEIVYKFPHQEELGFEVTNFCFPDGVKTRLVKKSDSMSDMNKVVYGSLSELEKPASNFTFLVTNDKSVFYGVCVVNEEFVENIPSFVHHQAATQNTETFKQYMDRRSTRICMSAPRVYCFITRERLYTIESASGPLSEAMTSPSFTTTITETSLNSTESDSIHFQSPKPSKRENETHLEISIPISNLRVPKVFSNDVINILKNYYSQIVPKAGEEISFTLPGELHSHSFHCPKGDEDSLLGDWTLPVVFKFLPLEKILLVINAALLEKKIIVVCSSPGILSSVVLSVIPLLRPFIWQGPFIPILPSSLSEYLQAPVPLVCGVLELSHHQLSELKEAFILNLDSGEVSLPSTGIVPLPHSKTLESTLKGLISPFGTLEKNFNPFKSSVDHVEASRKILAEIKNYYGLLLEFVSPYLHPGIDLYKENSTEKEILLETLPKTHREFFKHFIMCQMFAEKIEDLLLELAEKEQNAKSMMDRLNEKISALEMERQKAQETVKQAQQKIRECDERITSLKDAKHSLLDPSKKKKQFKLFNFASMLNKSPDDH